MDDGTQCMFCSLLCQPLGGVEHRIEGTMSLKQYISLDAMLIVLLALVFIAMDSCASRVASSTDDHHRIPKIDCSMIKFQGHMQEICCEQERCFLTE